MRPSIPGLAGCAIVYRALYRAGFGSGLDHTGPGLWPRLEERDADLNPTPEPQWLDRIGAAVCDLLRGHAGDPVNGHGDCTTVAGDVFYFQSRKVSCHGLTRDESQPMPSSYWVARTSS